MLKIYPSKFNCKVESGSFVSVIATAEFAEGAEKTLIN